MAAATAKAADAERRMSAAKVAAADAARRVAAAATVAGASPARAEASMPGAMPGSPLKAVEVEARYEAQL